MKKIKFQWPGKSRTGAPSAQTVPTTEAIIEQREQGQNNSYNDIFLRSKKIKARQSVYISKELHSSIGRLVHVLALSGEEISVGSYIDNVLADHMEKHKGIIADLYHQQLDKF